MTINKKLTVAALSLLSFFALIARAVAQGQRPISVPKMPTDLTFKSLRDVQYCEVWLIVGTPETGLKGEYYNTADLNNTANKMDTCPAGAWASVNPEDMKSRYDVVTALKNGPRGFTMDTIKIPTGPVVTFDGVNTRWMGAVLLPKGLDFKGGVEPYKPLRSHRKSMFIFEKGKPVFILEDAQGTPWVMQAYSKIVDPALTYDSLNDIGTKLKPPEGWKFRVVVLKKDLTISTPEDYNWIVQDELGNIYDACKAGACNFKP
jgi:hypothetical protein